MLDPRLEDHAVGLELQIIELVDRLQWAVAQERSDDAVALQKEIEQLQDELVRTTERLAS
jgi:hypothetical protein